ncbi:hypothetical protein Pan54_24500 [Rubinisphaera italica]|uniref:Uncharacterized protein n=1 Tax=Rubinisphaera italica TaxID=2527969 RepID=A0A5C5XHC8_9PLAN|nr:hypothetical protein Pan54_24500 [Rubinisphaera italica]
MRRTLHPLFVMLMSLTQQELARQIAYLKKRESHFLIQQRSGRTTQNQPQHDLRTDQPRRTDLLRNRLLQTGQAVRFRNVSGEQTERSSTASTKCG